MKYIYLLILGMLIVFYSCKKDESQKENNASGKMNNIEWNTDDVRAFFSTGNETSFEINITAQNENEFDFLGLSFRDVPLAEGSYSLIPFLSGGLASTNFVPLDGDVLLGVYHLLESDSSNHITVSHYDTELNKISGTFQATYIVDSLDIDRLIDTVKITNGVFSAHIMN